jgi:hypothetical protein
MFRTSLRPFYIMGSLIVVLLIVTAGAGLLDPGMYPPFVKMDALYVGLVVQDAASLFAAPLLAAAMYFTASGSVRALVTWCGLLVYVAYYYAFYCFGYTYTAFYPLYLALMGLAGYSLAGLLTAVDATAFARHAGPRLPVRLVAGVLGLTILFIPLWLMQIAQGIRTQQVTETGLVFVLDLAVLIPAALYAAWHIWRRRPQGYLIGGVMIFKAAASGILLTGGSIRQIMLGYAVGPDFGMYIFLAVVGSVALALYMRNLQGEVVAQGDVVVPAG